jgi:uncharacterized protein YihD (DUF1040 family)
MRSPERIKSILNIIERIWEKQPELRLTQLFSNAAISGGWKSNDLYYLEDNKLLKFLLKYEEKYYVSSTGKKK